MQLCLQFTSSCISLYYGSVVNLIYFPLNCGSVITAVDRISRQWNVCSVWCTGLASCWLECIFAYIRQVDGLLCLLRWLLDGWLWACWPRPWRRQFMMSGDQGYVEKKLFLTVKALGLHLLPWWWNPAYHPTTPTACSLNYYLMIPVVISSLCSPL